ncbi:hypothetical protein T310_6047, partial [Rasamsonia emersonii CBS 393.64]
CICRKYVPPDFSPSQLVQYPVRHLIYLPPTRKLGGDLYILQNKRRGRPKPTRKQTYTHETHEPIFKLASRPLLNFESNQNVHVTSIAVAFHTTDPSAPATQICKYVI